MSTNPLLSVLSWFGSLLLWQLGSGFRAFLRCYSEEMQMREAQGSLRPGSLGAIIAGEVAEME